MTPTGRSPDCNLPFVHSSSGQRATYNQGCDLLESGTTMGGQLVTAAVDKGQITIRAATCWSHAKPLGDSWSQQQWTKGKLQSGLRPVGVTHNHGGTAGHSSSGQRANYNQGCDLLESRTTMGGQLVTAAVDKGQITIRAATCWSHAQPWGDSWSQQQWTKGKLQSGLRPVGVTHNHGGTAGHS